MPPRPFAAALASLLAGAALAGCLHADTEPERAPKAEPASIAGRFEDRGVTVTVRAWGCGGVYGRWHARVRVSGLVRGRSADSFTIHQGGETAIEDEFPVRLSGVPATAELDLRADTDGAVVAVRGAVRVEALFRSIESDVDEELPIRRGAVPECE